MRAFDKIACGFCCAGGAEGLTVDFDLASVDEFEPPTRQRVVLKPQRYAMDMARQARSELEERGAYLCCELFTELLNILYSGKPEPDAQMIRLQPYEVRSLRYCVDSKDIRPKDE